MGADINIPLEKLESLGRSLQQIIDEFEAARSRGDALEAAIGAPHGETALRSEIERFEGAWDDKRETLKEALQGILERVEGVGSGWVDFDIQSASDLELAAE